MAPPRPGWSTALAVLLPALVVAAWAWMLGGSDEGTSDFSALKVVSDMEGELAETQPEVIVLGNSASWHGVDEVALGAALGFPGKVSKLFVPGSRTPAWYLVLKNRILAGGQRPKLVLVVAPLVHTLDTEVTEFQERHLRAQLADDDAGLIDAVMGRSLAGGLIARSKVAAEGWFELPKLWVVGALYGDSGDWEADGRKVAGAALDKVFDLEKGTDMSLHSRILPVAQIAVKEGGDPLRHMDLERSYLGELVDLAARHDVRVVLVDFPIPASNPAPRLPIDLRRQVVEWLNGVGAGWIDLSALPLPGSAFFDQIHLNAAGRRDFTRALIEALRTLDPLSGEGVRPSAVPLEVGAIERRGVADPVVVGGGPKSQGECRFILPLPALGALSNKALYDALHIGDASPLVLSRADGTWRAHVQPGEQACDDTFVHTQAGIVFSPSGGSADGVTVGWNPDLPALARAGKAQPQLWWVYPGTTLVLSFDEAWEAARGEAGLVVEAVAPAGGAGFVARMAGVEVPFAESNGALRAEGVVAAPAGPWTVEIQAPSGGGPLLVRSVAVGRGTQATPVLGELPQRASVRILGSRHPERRIEIVTPPPALSLDARIKRDKADGIPRARIALGAYEGLTSPAVKERVARGGCSPLRLTEDGVLQPKPDAAFNTLAVAGKGAAATQGGSYVFTASDDSDPTANGRAYALVLDEERMCGQALWLYPGDQTTVVVDPLGTLPGGAATLELSGAEVRAGTQGHRPVGIKVTLDGDLALQMEFDPSQLSELIERPIYPPRVGARRVEITFRNPPDGAFVLLTGVSISEPAPDVMVADTEVAVGGAAGGARALGVDLSAVRSDPKDLRKLALFEAGKGDSRWTPVTGPLGPGLRFEASNPEGSSRLCTGRFRVRAAGDVRAHVRVERVQGGAGKAQTLLLETSWFTASGPASADGKPVRDSRPLAPGDWRWETMPMVPPAGAEHAQVCVRFAKSTGALDIDGLEASGL